MKNRKPILGHICVCEVGGCVCLCVCEREWETDGQTDKQREGCVKRRFHMTYYDHMGHSSLCQALSRDALHTAAWLIPLSGIGIAPFCRWGNWGMVTQPVSVRDGTGKQTQYMPTPLLSSEPPVHAFSEDLNLGRGLYLPTQWGQRGSRRSRKEAQGI